MPKTLASLVLALLALIHFTLAANNASNIPSAVYTYSANGQELVIALNIDQAKQDLYLHMSMPSTSSWIGMGIGNEMQGALMFIAYASANGSGVTLSPRIATGHSEPSYYKDAGCSLVYAEDLVDGNTVQNNNNGGSLIVNAVCTNVTHWNQRSLDFTKPSVNQSFIFAVGPSPPIGSNMQSDSPTAGLTRHIAYGFFTMDLSKAASSDSSTAGVPRPNASGNTYIMTNAAAGSVDQDNDHAPGIHAFVMCFSYLILFPLGAIALRTAAGVRAHVVVQCFGLFLVICGTVGGFILSTQYNRSKNFQSGHQIIGIVLFLAMIVQFGLGLINHRIFLRTNQGTIMGKIHRYLGPAAIILGLVNALLGFVLAQMPHLCLPYSVVVILFAIIFCLIRFREQICCRNRRKRQQQQPDVNLGPVGGGPEGYQYPQFVPGPQQHPGPYMEPPPAYGRPAYDRQPSYRSEGEGGEGEGLRPYESQSSGIYATAPPVYPRPMV